MKVFISYRRAITAGQAGRLYDRITQTKPNWTVFLDVEEIPAGVMFDTYISNEIDTSDVFLLLLARGTFDRINQPDDWVRKEIELALNKKSIQVIPVLVDGFAMPDPKSLPLSLQTLPGHNAEYLRHELFDETSNRIIEHISIYDKRPRFSFTSLIGKFWSVGRNPTLIGWMTIIGVIVALSGLTLPSLINQFSDRLNNRNSLTAVAAQGQPTLSPLSLVDSTHQAATPTKVSTLLPTSRVLPTSTRQSTRLSSPTKVLSSSINGLTLTVLSVKNVNGTAQICMSAANNSQSSRGLPLFGNLFVVDNNNNQISYDQSPPPDWPGLGEISPGAKLSGCINMNVPIDDQASLVTVRFAHISGVMGIQSIQVNNVPVMQPTE